MPFKSQAQRRFMYSQHPELAAEFEDATPKDKKLPKKLHPEKTVKKAYEAGVEAALIRFGLKQAGEEIRLKIPNRKYHGYDEAWRSAAKTGEGSKSADEHTPPLEPQAHPQAPVEQLTAILQKLDGEGGGPMDMTKNPLDRTTLWGGATNPDAGDTATRDMSLNVGMGPSGAAF